MSYISWDYCYWQNLSSSYNFLLQILIALSCLHLTCILMHIKTLITETSNYITKQHNELSEWLHENLCLIYAASGGSCDRFIGPLTENQAHIPMQFYWPEGQPTLIDRLEQFQTNLPLAGPNDLVVDDKDGSSKGMGKSMDDLKAIKDDLDALSNDMQHKVDTLKDEMREMKDEMKNEMREMKDLIFKLMGTMNKE